jgi:hypothetical protein
MALFFPAAGADLVIAADYCNGKFGSATGGASALASCSSQCAPLIRGYGNCQNVECLCPTVSSNGVACSDCLAAINTGDASVVGSLMNQCGIGGGSPQTFAASVTSPQTIVVLPTGSNLASQTAAPVTAATSTSRSAGQGTVAGLFQGNYFGIFGFIAIVLGSIAILM